MAAAAGVASQRFMNGLLADETMALAKQASRRVLADCGEGEAPRTQLAVLRRLARFTPANAAARHVVAFERYPV